MNNWHGVKDVYEHGDGLEYNGWILSKEDKEALISKLWDCFCDDVWTSFIGDEGFSPYPQGQDPFTLWLQQMVYVGDDIANDFIDEYARDIHSIREHSPLTFEELKLALYIDRQNWADDGEDVPYPTDEETVEHYEGTSFGIGDFM